MDVLHDGHYDPMFANVSYRHISWVLDAPRLNNSAAALNRQSQKMKTSYLLGLILTWVYWRGSNSVSWKDCFGKRAFSITCFRNMLWKPWVTM